jgi:hypothetical protein
LTPYGVPMQGDLTAGLRDLVEPGKALEAGRCVEPLLVHVAFGEGLCQLLGARLPRPFGTQRSRERSLGPLAEVQPAGGCEDSRRIVRRERALSLQRLHRRADIDQRPTQRPVSLGGIRVQ